MYIGTPTNTTKKLYVGMTLVGLIKEINDLDMSVSLPNQLTGFVSITDITSKMTELVEEAADEESVRVASCLFSP